MPPQKAISYLLNPPVVPRCTTVQLPASKSISNRALILHTLAKGKIFPTNLSDCDDTKVLMRALSGNLERVDIRAAGTAMRFLTAYFSVTPGRHLLTGTLRMQQRPIRILVDALRELGAEINYVGKEGFPPLCIKGGKLRGGTLSLAGDISSQYISALLMIAPLLPNGLKLQLTGNLVSRSYIHLTLQLMVYFGATVQWESESCIVVAPGGYCDVPFVVESDWSAASYWYELLALSGRVGQSLPKKAGTGWTIRLLGLFADSCQGDRRTAEIFSKLGIRTEYCDDGVCLTCEKIPVTRLEEDLVESPDLAQTLVVTCCLMDIPFRFTGLQTLRIKETDRIQALVTELYKLGYLLFASQDGTLSWDGAHCQAEEAPVISTYEDHRMAMAFAPTCLRFSGVRILEPHVVSKSYPGYWNDLQRAGFSIEIDKV